MKESHFKDNFWSTDFNSTAGYDNLIQHLNDGKKTCKEIEDFIKARATIEEKYGKELINLSRKVCGQTELNTMKRALDVFKQQIENIGQAHAHLAQSLREEAKRLEDFRERQKDSRKKVEQFMESLYKQKTSQYKKTMESKKTYEQKCREKEEAEQNLNRNANTSNVKQQEKLQTKSQQTKAAADDADKVYQQNVTLMEKVRDEWQKEHIKSCEHFETQEVERIHNLRNIIWTHVNQLSQQCVTSDEFYEEVRKSLEQCSVQKDIEYFIDLRRTGETPPAPIPYENFYNGQRPNASRSQVQCGRRGPLPSPSTTPSDGVYSTAEDPSYSLVRY
ncbi:proline-serine-threonine phosphatase-interacting protein 2 [Erpetoichthys calabaricus]|uniref:Proline-serine-threonine phosphatase interacting protein 2 n=1 Tax=Erpetoichthys calabaricus TaxID=27687 RepID=A0A8C4T5K4_ERPCA|nr:proline-serine-threonine phosphatase-interacting protein 2 [Erpetoichthys calabaricus]